MAAKRILSSVTLRCWSFYPLSAVNLNVLKSQGRSDLFLRLEIIKKMLVAASVYITYRWGINAMILGAITTSIISYFLNTYYTEKLINYSIVEQLADLVPVVFITAIMGFSVFYIQSYTFSSEMVLLISQILLGISIYALLSLFFRRHFFVSVVTTLFKTR
ncbi:MAG: polysaccharide biosynthesis C-terminal domain-containing protein [Candidatus Sedimenticola sp. (ex Thyasira tokunagai)]